MPNSESANQSASHLMTQPPHLRERLNVPPTNLQLYTHSDIILYYNKVLLINRTKYNRIKSLKQNFALAALIFYYYFYFFCKATFIKCGKIIFGCI